MWSKGNRNWTLVILSGLTIAVVALTMVIVLNLKVRPVDVMMELRRSTAATERQTEVIRSQVEMNTHELERLRERNTKVSEMLKRANEALLKLDPHYQIEVPYE